ncbi:hypothetical protein KG166_003958 [Salmonella enterica subsp. enterica serovar Eastbourne]|nr:hypothetical protein [Salmonella enterica subsp. enterica serovar Eastbourne]
MVTQSIVDEDIRMISEQISDKCKELVKPTKVLRIAFLYPSMLIVGYLIAFLYVKLTYTPYVNSFGDLVSFSNAMSAEVATTCFGILFALIIGFVLYGPVLVYLSLPEKIRNASLVISSIRGTCIKTIAIVTSLNWGVAILGATVNTTFLCLSPAMILISIFVTQFVVNAEIARYGLGAVMGKINKVLRNI